MQSYGPLCTAFYDADKPSAPDDALSYYLRLARQAGGPALEPMGGSDRFLLPLLRVGVDIDGVNAAPAMLDACRRPALRGALQPTLYMEALKELALPREYALAFVPPGSTGLLAEPALSAVLCRVQQHLEAGASLLLELLDTSADVMSHDQSERFSALLDACAFHPVIDHGCSAYASMRSCGCILIETKAARPAGR